MGEDGMIMITLKMRVCDKHASKLNAMARSVNFVWNYCNEMSKKSWDDRRRWLSRFDMDKLTAGSSKDLGISAHTVSRVCATFAASRDKRRRPGLRWRNKKSLGWVPFRNDCVSFDGNSFRYFGHTIETMHLDPRLIAGTTSRTGSFNRDSSGRWYLNFTVPCAPVPSRGYAQPVGIDLGLRNLAATSDGAIIESGRFYRKSEERLATLRRANKTRRVRSIEAKVANRRRDALHKASTAIVKTYGLIFVGNVRSSRMVKSDFAKSIHDAGWAAFKHMLSYKALMHGGKLIEVNEAFTSQTCSHCGSTPHGRPEGIAGLGIREWKCSDCGTVHDRDVNAARNILRIGLDTLAGGARSLADGSRHLSGMAASTIQAGGRS
jgi:putative transposase